MAFSRLRRLICMSGALAPLGCLGGRTPPKETRAAGFSFIQATDLHYIERPSTRAEMARLVEGLNAWRGQADFVVFTGDLTEHATPEAFAGVAEALARLELPWYALPGNHDMNPAAWLAHFPDYDSFSRRHRGHALLFLDSNEEEDPVWVTLSPRKLVWLDEQLARIPRETPILLFLHHPLAPDCPKYGIRNAEAVLARFSDRKLLAAVSGHYHSLWESRRDGVLFTTSTCLLETRRNHDGTTAKGCRLFNVEAGRVSSRYLDFTPGQGGPGGQVAAQTPPAAAGQAPAP